MQSSTNLGQDTHEQRFVAPDMGRALRMLGEELGPDAILLSSRKVSDGVEIVALPPGGAASTDDINRLHSDRRSSDRRIQDRRTTKKNEVENSTDKPVAAALTKNNASDAIDADISSAASRLAQSIGSLTAIDLAAAQDTAVGAKGAANADSVNSRFGVESGVAAFENLQRELQKVRQMLEQQIESVNPAGNSLPEPTQYLLMNRVLQMGIPVDLARAITAPTTNKSIIDKPRIDNKSLNQTTSKRISADQRSTAAMSGDGIEPAWQQCCERLAQMMPIANQDLLHNGGIIALLGPSGAGKSSAIAKLAARYLLAHSAADIAIISHDAGSTAGSGRLSRFSSMTGIPVFYVDKDHSLAARITQCAKRRLVFIDTVSKTEENAEADKQLATLADLKQVKSLIVLPATGEMRWISRMIRQYQLANTVGCVLSHMDQVESLGGVLAALVKQQLPVHYQSDGGLLPKYIQQPDRKQLLAKLLNIDSMSHSTGMKDSDVNGDFSDDVVDMLTPVVTTSANTSVVEPQQANSQQAKLKQRETAHIDAG